MNNKISIAAAVILSSLLVNGAPSAYAAPNGSPKAIDVVSLAGKCDEVFLFGANATDRTKCIAFIKAVFSDGRSQFVFMSADSTTLTFGGPTKDQGLDGSKDAEQRIDWVGWGNVDSGKMEKVAASMGVCSFASPLQAKPSVIKCIAKTDQGWFNVVFSTDGSKPNSIVEKDGVR